MRGRTSQTNQLLRKHAAMQEAEQKRQEQRRRVLDGMAHIEHKQAMTMERVKEEYDRRLTKKLMNLQIKDLGDNMLVGYASHWGFPADAHGDVVRRGAFRNSMDRINRGAVPLLDSHIYDAAHTIGTVIRGEEDEHGFKIWAKLSASPTALDIKQKLVEGHLGRLSIGYDVIKESYGKDPETKKSVRFLNEVKLFEVSVVPIPANEHAKILEVKEMKAAADHSPLVKLALNLIDDLDLEQKELAFMDIQEAYEDIKIRHAKQKWRKWI